MMIFRALDEDGDWTFGNGINSFLTDASAMVENLKTRIRTWKRECFFATELGVDWDNYLGIGTQAFLEVDIRRVILGSDGVIRIDDFTGTLDRHARNITIQANVLTVFGTLPFSGVF
jgi:hypothetical protein